MGAQRCVRLDRSHAGTLVVVPPFECAWLYSEDLRLPEPSRGCVAFEAKGDNDVTVIFKRTPGSKRQQYEDVNYTVILGSHKNSRICIESNGVTTHMAQGAHVPGAVLDTTRFQRYWVDLNGGVVTIGTGEPGVPPYHRWENPTPEETFEYVGLSSWDKHICYRNFTVTTPLAFGCEEQQVSAWDRQWEHEAPNVAWFCNRNELSDITLKLPVSQPSRAKSHTQQAETVPKDPSDRRDKGHAARGCAGDKGATTPSDGAANAAREGSSDDEPPQPTQWERVPAHRSVLAAWCPRFAEQSATAEEVELPGVRPKELAVFLHHCYGGSGAGLSTAGDTDFDSLRLLCEKMGADRELMERLVPSKRATSEAEEREGDAATATTATTTVPGSSGTHRLCSAAPLADMQLCVNGQQIPAHRLLLSVSSQPFYKMLTNGFRESILHPQVTLHDTTEEAVRVMLSFLTTGTLDLSSEADGPEAEAALLVEVLLLSEKFAVYSLSQACCGRLAATLSPWSALRVLQLTEGVLAPCRMYQQLHAVAVGYAAAHLEAASSLPGWSALAAASAREVLTHTRLERTATGEAGVLSAVWRWARGSMGEGSAALESDIMVGEARSKAAAAAAVGAGGGEVGAETDESAPSTGTGEEWAAGASGRTSSDLATLVALVRFALFSDLELAGLQAHPLTAECSIMRTALAQASKYRALYHSRFLASERFVAAAARGGAGVAVGTSEGSPGGDSATTGPLTRSASLSSDQSSLDDEGDTLELLEGWKVVRRPAPPARSEGGETRYCLTGANLLQRQCRHRELVYLGDGEMSGALHFIGTVYGTATFRNPAVTHEVAITASSSPGSFTDPKRLASRSNSRCSYAGPAPSGDGWGGGGGGTGGGGGGGNGGSGQASRTEAWWQVDLGPRRRLFCNYYTMQWDRSAQQSLARGWALQGSEDGQTWATLRTHLPADAAAAMGKAAGALASWPVDRSAALLPFRHFRVLMVAEAAEAGNGPGDGAPEGPGGGGHGGGDASGSGDLRFSLSAIEFYGTLEYDAPDEKAQWDPQQEAQSAL